MVALALPGAAPDGLRRPIAEITLGSASADDVAAHLLACELQRGLLPQVDRVRLTLASAGPAPEVEDRAEVALGYQDDGTETVFSGQVLSVRDGIGGLREVVLAGGAAALARTRVLASYEQQTAGDIVSDLASRAGVSTGTIEPGSEYPFVAFDDRSSVLDHVARLARHNGFISLLASDDSLELRAIADGPVQQSFAYGVDLLSLQVTAAGPALGELTAVGQGAAGSAGQEAWSWLVKDPAPVTATAGEGTPARLLAHPSLRTGQAVQGAADGAVALSALGRARGQLWVPGAQAVQVGGVVEIGEVPTEALNGSALVTQLLHRFDKHSGFTTRLRVAMLGGGLGGLSGLAGGLL